MRVAAGRESVHDVCDDPPLGMLRAMSEAGGPGGESSTGELVSRLSEQVTQLVRHELQQR